MSRGTRVRAVTTACCVSFLGVLSLDCGGTFCDEYPAACGAVGGGSEGGSGGGPATGAGGPGGGPSGGAGAAGGEGGGIPVGPFDVSVSLVDFEGDAAESLPVLVSGADGSVIEQTDTGPTGSVTVSVPDHGRVSLFYDDGSQKQVFSAEVVEGVNQIAFQLPTPLNQPVLQVVISTTCASNCNVGRELTVSCRDSEQLVDTSSPYTQSVQSFYGCPGSGLFDAFIVAYGPGGQAIAATSGYDLQSSVENHSLPALVPLALADISEVSLEIEGLLPGFSAKRRVSSAYDDRPGFSYSRTIETDDPVVDMSLVEAFLPAAWAEFTVTTTPTQLIARREPIESVDDDVSLTFDVGSLAIPALPGTVDLTTPGQPLAPFGLGPGPLGDAIQLVLYRDTSLVWTVALPSAASGEVLFPELPTELQAYAVTQVDDFVIQHSDVDDTDGYAEWANEVISPPFEWPTRAQTLAVSQ